MTDFGVTILSFFFACVFVEYGVALFIRVAEKFYLLSRSKGCLCLTYDDGPSERFQTELLKLLNQLNVKATFFINGKNAEKMRGRCKELVENGHELGYHGYEHFKFFKVSPWKFYKDLKKTRKVLDFCVKSDGYHRFPYGKFYLSTWIISMFYGSTPIHWTVDSGDTRPQLPDVKVIVDKVVRNGGGIVLMHSFDRIETPSIEKYVLELTKSLVLQAKPGNMKISTLSDLKKKRC